MGIIELFRVSLTIFLNVAICSGSMLQSTVETQENPEAHTFQWEQEPQLPPVRQVKQRNDKVSDKQITTAEDFVKKIRRDQFLKAREELAGPDPFTFCNFLASYFFINYSENDKDGSLLALDRIWCQIPPINKMSSDEIANMIVKDIIFDNGMSILVALCCHLHLKIIVLRRFDRHSEALRTSHSWWPRHEYSSGQIVTKNS